MATSEEAPEIIDGYPNFERRPRSPITDGYKNEDYDRFEYEQSKGVLEEISLKDKVDIHESLEDKDAIQDMGKDAYHEEDPNIISEESNDEVSE